MSMYRVPPFCAIDFTGSRTYSCSADIFRTDNPLTMIQRPAIPAAEGTSYRGIEEVRKERPV